MRQKWYQSKAVWASGAALVGFVLKTWFNVEIPEWDTFIALLFAALMAFGVVNNPTSKDTI